MTGNVEAYEKYGLKFLLAMNAISETHSRLKARPHNCKTRLRGF
jgi:hypothetical protein